MSRPSVPRLQLDFCSYAADFLSVLFKVTDMAYTECHAVRGHSVVLLHRLLDVYLFSSSTLYSLGQRLKNKY